MAGPSESCLTSALSQKTPEFSRDRLGRARQARRPVLQGSV